MEQDLKGFREFVKDADIPVVACQSFSKNFGLYGERVGCCSVICGAQGEVDAITRQMKNIARKSYTSPPLYGARLVKTVLQSPELTQVWQAELLEVSGRIKKMRHALYDKLRQQGSTRNWDHVVNQIGMFTYSVTFIARDSPSSTPPS